jgi:chitinase
MNDDTKQDRTKLYKSLNMAGVIDWAVDLNGYEGADISPGAAANIVYPPQSIWDSSDPMAACKPPCVVVLPPYPLTGAHTVSSWPALTTTLLSSNAADGRVYVKTTTIPVPTFVISEVNLQPVTLYATDTDQYTINPMQSITPPSFLWTLPPNYATFPATTLTPAASNPAVSNPATSMENGVPMTTNSVVATSSDSDVPLTIIPLVTFFPTSIAVTIQPQPTFSVEYPKPPVTGGPLTLNSTSITKPSSTKTGTSPTSTSDSDSDSGSGSDKRGTRDCRTFGCPGGKGSDNDGGSDSSGGCGMFSCGGGCGIFGCGGGCGVTGCIPSCPLGSCGGLGCLLPGGCGNTQGSGGGDSSNECETKVTVSACTYLVTSYSAWYLASSTTTTEVSLHSLFSSTLIRGPERQ